MSDSTIRILGIAGSLRRRSFNRGLLREAQAVAPDGVEFDIFDLSDVPLYNEDSAGPPEPVPALPPALPPCLQARPARTFDLPSTLRARARQ